MVSSNASNSPGAPGTLRRALLQNLTTATLIPLLLLAAAVLAYLTDRATVDAAGKTQLLARAISGQVEVFLQAPAANLLSLSSLYQSHQSMNLETFQELLDAQTEGSSLIELIYLLDSNGRVTHVGLPHENQELRDEFSDMMLGHRDFIQKAWQLQKPVWSDTFLSVISGKTSLALAVPMQDRMIIGNINIDRVNQFLKDVHQDELIETTIVDRRGEIIACSRQTPEMCPTNLWNLPLVREGISKTEKTSSYEFNGELFLGSVARIEGPGWLTLVAQTSDDAYQPVRRTSYFFLSVVMVTLLTVSGVVALLAKLISAPIYRFADQARSLAGGNYRFDYQAPGYSELATLADAMQHMVDRISEREAALVKSETAYRTLAENLPAIAYRLHLHDNFRLQFMNEEHRKMTGLETWDFSSHDCCPFGEFVHPDDLADFISTIKGAIAGEVPFTQEYRFRHADGEYRTFFEKGCPVASDNGEIHHIDGVIFDITDRKRAEEIILQSEKMLTVGGLAAGMAHEINNPLAGILQNCQLICQRLDPDHEKNRQLAAETEVDLDLLQRYLEKRRIPSMLEAIRDSGQRAARIVENILDFSRKGREDFVAQSMVELIDKTLELARSDYDLHKDFDFRNIRIDAEHEADQASVKCDPSQIQQVLLNIFKNGAQAMNEEASQKTPCFTIRTYTQQEMNCIEIADNGPGMPPAVQKRIFEPFFTTKDVGKGTGLGLSVCYFIITEKHQGSMAVDSTSGEGTRFTICLPRGTQAEQT